MRMFLTCMLFGLAACAALAADEDNAPKILGRNNSGVAIGGRPDAKGDEANVIRVTDEQIKEQTKDEKGVARMKMSNEQVAKDFKVKDFDWKTHMILNAPFAPSAKSTIVGLEMKDGTLIVKWKATPFRGQAFGGTQEPVVVLRHLGKVKFVKQK